MWISKFIYLSNLISEIALVLLCCGNLICCNLVIFQFSFLFALENYELVRSFVEKYNTHNLHIFLQQKLFQNAKTIYVHSSFYRVSLSGQNKCTTLNYSIIVIHDCLEYIYEYSNPFFANAKLEKIVSAQDIRSK